MKKKATKSSATTFSEFPEHVKQSVFRLLHCKYLHEQIPINTNEGIKWICKECSKNEEK